jgi:hypothetical protein
MRSILLSAFLIAVVSAAPRVADASTIVIDFETFSDLDAVTTQFPGMTFANTTVLTSGISLNELESPPVSGTNVVVDDIGPISISFATPMLTVGGYFTYLAPLTLEAFDSSNVSIGTVSSTFLSNLALSGDAGSSPNEFLALTFATGISSIVLTGDPFGGSFVLDDLTLTPVAVPESGPGMVLLLVFVAFSALRSGRFFQG